MRTLVSHLHERTAEIRLPSSQDLHKFWVLLHRLCIKLPDTLLELSQGLSEFWYACRSQVDKAQLLSLRVLYTCRLHCTEEG